MQVGACSNSSGHVRSLTLIVQRHGDRLKQAAAWDDTPRVGQNHTFIGIYGVHT